MPSESNPQASPSSIFIPITLTTYQLKTLKVYLRWHSQPPTVASVIGIYLRRWLLLAVFIVAGGLFLLNGWRGAGGLIIGLPFGAFLRDIAGIRATFRVWPVYQEIVNWKHVKELIEEHEGVVDPSV